MSVNNTPLEYDEECALSDYLDRRHFIHWHTPQETYTKSWAQKRKNAAMGVRKGVCDHWAIIPTKMGFKMLVAIEMKRIRGGTVSDEQIEIIQELNKAQGVMAVVCYGAEEAIRVVRAVEENNAGKIKDIIDQTTSLSLENNKKRKNPRKSPKKPKNSCPF